MDLGKKFRKYINSLIKENLTLKEPGSGIIPPPIDDENNDGDQENGEGPNYIKFVHTHEFDGEFYVLSIQRNRELGTDNIKKALRCKIYENDKMRAYFYVDFSYSERIESNNKLKFTIDGVVNTEIMNPETIQKELINLVKFNLYDKHDITDIHFTEFDVRPKKGTYEISKSCLDL